MDGAATVPLQSYNSAKHSALFTSQPGVSYKPWLHMHNRTGWKNHEIVGLSTRGVEVLRKGAEKIEGLQGK